MNQENCPSILLIEDDMIERMKFNRILSTLGLQNKVVEAINGEEALRVLEKKDALPNIILLDLNMPRISGVEFLKILKNDETLKYIPAIVLTTSNNQKDLVECYKIGIAGYILKPLKYEDYVDKLSRVLSYWNVNQLVMI